MIPYDDEVERAILQRTQHHPQDSRIKISRKDLEDIVRDAIYGAVSEKKIAVLDSGVVGKLAANIALRSLLSP